MKKNLLFLFCIVSILNSYSQEFKWELKTSKYETPDAFVIGLNVMDYDADPTGETDQTALFQRLLDTLGSRILDLSNRNGGTLYVPEGKYLFTGNLVIPKGVTIRGEWEKPEKGKPIKGTVFMVRTGRGYDASVGVSVNEIRSFITLQPTASVKYLNIWYPDQDPENLVAYPPSILFGHRGYWGNDYVCVSNITLVNSFDGIMLSRYGDGGAPNCFGIYGTPLRRGIEYDGLGEVGRIDEVDFSPDYWAGSGLEGSPAMNGPHKKWMYENGTAVIMRRIDWSIIGKMKIDGYNVGLYYGPSVSSEGSTPNGSTYGSDISNCKYGVKIEAMSGAGMMFYDCKIENCDYGFYVSENNRSEGIFQVLGCDISAKYKAFYTPEQNKTKSVILQSKINKGSVDVRGGLVSIVNNDFNDEEKHLILGAEVRAIVTGNRFNGEPDIKNVSLYECKIDHTPIEMTELPKFPYKNQFEFKQKPSGNAFYLATDNGVSTDADDNSPALQICLNKAKADGGGVVFIPPGRYNFKTPITIPTGVELKGSVDTPSSPTGPGTVLEVYVGKNDEFGDPFISMEKGSGVRGLVINYPEQTYELLYPVEQLPPYSYAIRGNADVYIINIGFRTTYNAIDLFTNKCDNYFVNYPSGYIFRNCIRVGGGTKGGHIYNSQFNSGGLGYGGETKHGKWPNSHDRSLPNSRDIEEATFAYCWNHVEFLVLEDCEDQILFNNFDFGSNRGVVLREANGKAPNGLCLGQGIDQGMKAIAIEAINEKGFDFINSQIVTTQLNDNPTVLQAYKDGNRYIQTYESFTGKVTFWGAEFWGTPKEISNEVLGGTVELQAGNFANSGQRIFASVAEEATFDIIGTNINPINSLLTTGSAPQFNIQSSFVNPTGVNIDDCGLWYNNQNHSASKVITEAYLKRTGWVATASHRDEDANNALDDNLNTRWTTGTSQRPGQWFMVDMLEERTFNGLYLDAGGNNFRPQTAVVSVSNDAVNWETLVTVRIPEIINFEVQNARYIKVEQTGTASGVWRISEFYVINTYIPDDNVAIKAPKTQTELRVWFTGDQLNVSGIEGDYSIQLYSVSGQLVGKEIVPGVYIAIIKNKGNVYRIKVMKNK